MDVYEAIYTTRAMRRMKPDPVPQELVAKLFDAAVRGPSGGNTQLFRFLTVTDPDTKQEVQRIYRECLDELNATQYAAVQDTIDTGDATDPAVALIFVFGKPGGETTTFPCLWNFCLAARAEGLGTAITTLLKLQKDRVERLLGLPEDEPLYNMHGMIPLGYPTGNWGVAQRKPAHESVFSETWGNPVDWTVDAPLWSSD